jgi:aspartate-semialdehyde dehydrogenase
MKKRVAILGATGMVGRRFAELLVNHPWFEIELLVGYKSIGERYQTVWERKEALMRQHYGQDFWTARPFPADLQRYRVASFDELLSSGSVELVFSAIHAGFGHLEDRLLARGFTIFSNSPHGRFEEKNPLVIAEVNGWRINGQTFIKNPNCVTSGLALTLAPLKERYGLAEVSVVTFQSLSGRGDAKYHPDLVVGNIYPLHLSDERTEEYIVQEVKTILGAQIPISVSCHRVYVQEGHLVDVKLKTVDRITDAREVAELFATYSPLKSLMLPSAPEAPILVSHEPGRPRPRQDAFHGRGFAVAVGGLSVADDVYDLRYKCAVNNLVRGAAGGAILNAEVWHRQSRINDQSPKYL